MRVCQEDAASALGFFKRKLKTDREREREEDKEISRLQRSFFVLGTKLQSLHNSH